MRHLLSAAGLAALVCVGSAAAQAQVCDRACLSGVMDSYLAALEAHDASKLSVTRNVKYTENGVRLNLGDGLWQTLSAAPDYRITVIDDEAGQVGLLGIINENGNRHFFAARLKVEEGERVSEIETLIARNTSGGGMGTDLKTPSPRFSEDTPEGERLPRGELAAIANHYFTGLDTEDSGENVPFSDDCQRRENGGIMANDPDAAEDSMQHRSCKEQFDTGFSVIVTDIRERRFEVVDRVKGLAFGWGFFDHNGTVEKFSNTPSGELVDVPAMFRQPFSFYIAEIFEIEDGKIRQIEAALTPVPFGMESGW
jgi:hypothetical protein